MPFNLWQGTSQWGDLHAQGITYKTHLVAQGFSQPTEIVFLPGSNTDMIVLEKTGKAKLVDLTTGRQQTIIDISKDIVSQSEQGLLGIAFSHRYNVDKMFFLSYTTTREDADGKEDISVVAKYEADIKRIKEPIRDMGKALFIQAQPFKNHNGGCIRVLQDGYLYLGLGDGGSGNDPFKNGQNPETNLGKLIRFKSTDITPVVEIYAMGLRNPWKFSADSETGEIYLADVGQSRVEEVNIIQKDGNYGWNVWEGDECFKNNTICRTKEGKAMIQPIHTYRHNLGNSITGGYVYRGAKIPQLYGKYIFGDFGSGRIWTLAKKANQWKPEEILNTKMNISTFGQSDNGFIYFASFGDGKVYRIGK
ncbi:MAG: PQQ-dependent sugar dehydrogenase [Leptospira sp.]|nr:PQQ-dependent sugar dehydrogenase [Leptospira sp.]